MKNFSLNFFEFHSALALSLCMNQLSILMEELFKLFFRHGHLNEFKTNALQLFIQFRWVLRVRIWKHVGQVIDVELVSTPRERFKKFNESHV